MNGRTLPNKGLVGGKHDELIILGLPSENAALKMSGWFACMCCQSLGNQT